MSLLHWLLIICRKLAIQTNPQRRFQQVYEETLILYFPLDLNVVRALWSLNLNLRTMSYVVERSEDKYEQAPALHDFVLLINSRVVLQITRMWSTRNNNK